MTSTAKKRVMFFAQSSWARGGVNTWLARIARVLPSLGWEVVIGVAKGACYHQPARFQEAYPDLPSIVVDGCHADQEGRIRSAMRALRKVEPDVVLPLCIVDANDAVCRLKQRRRDIRLVTHAHSNLPGNLADLRRYGQWLDLVVCPGKLAARFASTWAGIPKDRVRHVPNGADQPLLPRTPRRKGRPIRLGYVGRLIEVEKRVTDLIPLCRELRGQEIAFSLDIVGDGPCSEQLARELADEISQGIVRLHGSKPLEQIYQEIYPNLDILLLLSNSETFGIVLAEAMMHGVIPVTARYLGCAAEGLIRDYQTGLTFNVGDMGAAAVRIAELDRDPAMCCRLSEQAKQQCHQSYTWERCIAGWNATLEEAINREPRGGRQLPDTPRSSSGRLDRWGVPGALVDYIRRVRRRFGIAPVRTGGEEWPVHGNDYSSDLLCAITAYSKSLDIPDIAEEETLDRMTAI